MTFDDDFLALFGTEVADRWNVPLWKVGFEWPPPERIFVDTGQVVRSPGGVQVPAHIREALDSDPADLVMVRKSYSAISDAERAGLTHVARGAAYRYLLAEDET